MALVHPTVQKTHDQHAYVSSVPHENIGITVSGQLPARQCRIQNWFVLGIQRTSARVLFIHVCTSILKECVLFHWVHDAAWLLELRRRHFNDWVRFSFHDPKPWSSLLVEKMFTRSPSEDLCSIVSRTIDYWHFSILYFCSADPCPPVAHMWLLAPSTQGLSSANLQLSSRVDMFLFEIRVHEPIMLPLHCGHPINWSALNTDGTHCHIHGRTQTSPILNFEFKKNHSF